MNKLSREKQETIISLLVEGNSLRSVERITGVHRDTAMRLMVRVGNAVRRMLDFRMADLTLAHLQCDEIWTFVRKKQRRLSSDEQADDTIGDQYLFIALDESTKLIPAFSIGKRTKENTADFMRTVAARMRGFGPMNPANPLESIPMSELLTSHAEPHAPMVSTDGFAPYIEAVDDAFAGMAQHGVLIKAYHESDQPGRYAPPDMIQAERRPITKGMDPFDICTSHVERHNLSIRTFLRRFTRLALGFSKKLDNLAAAVAVYVGHYNYCRLHRTIRSTPTMAAGIAGHPWTIAELLHEAGV